MFIDRLEHIREIVDKKIEKIQDPVNRKLAYIHTYGVAQFCAMLASKRNTNVELACIAGMLHDISIYAENCPHKGHAQRSAELADDMLKQSGIFEKEEIMMITHAISVHSDKMKRGGGSITEVLKDADVLQHYFYNVNMEISASDKFRLFYLFEELMPKEMKPQKEED